MSPVSALSDLKNQLSGPLLTATDVDYDLVRKVWNGTVDKRPALIARCRVSNDVVACVQYAKEHGVTLSVRGGGHNYAGKAVCDNGLMLDFSLMKEAVIDARRRSVRAQAGLKLGEFDAETQKHGLATTMGVATTTGISGLTLGGGYGWLAGKLGLACDNLTWARVITADAQIVECSLRENADLFWGLRGAGANFGIVTELEYQLYPLTTVLGGPIFHPLNKAAIRFFDEFARAAPDELTVIGSAMTGPGGAAAFATVVCYCGAAEEGEKLLKPLRTYAKPLVDMIQSRPYVEMQSLFDASYPPGRRYYNKSHNLSRLTDAAIDVVLHYARNFPTPGSSIAFQQLHGAAGRVPVTDTAFPHRYDHYVIWVDAIGDDPAQDATMVPWMRECWQALTPYVDTAIYVNALHDEIEKGLRSLRDAYGSNYERLLALKRQYDPTNLFNQNSNIRPDLRPDLRPDQRPDQSPQ